MIDTNIRISALLTAGVARMCLEMVASSAHVVVSCPDLEAECEQVIRRKLLGQSDLLMSLYRRAELVSPVAPFKPVCRDPDDDRVLACAVAGDADVILTGDDDLLCLHPFRTIAIRTPRQFLTEFASASRYHTLE